MAFEIPARTTSYRDIYEAAVAFIQNKSDYEKFKDHYVSGIGTTQLELDAGFSEFRNYEARLARRETYLFDAKLVSSAVGIAESLGYSVYRGTNIHLRLTFLPSITGVIEEYTVIGSYNEYDIVALETKAVVVGEATTIDVALGNLLEESATIQSNKSFMFRFITPDVSEDIQVSINGQVVPTSKDLLHLNQDRFIVMSNAVKSVDIWYLNKFPPSAWVSGFKYSFDNYIMPSYKWRPNHTYAEGDYITPSTLIAGESIYFQCTKGGISSSSEPSWKTVVGSIVADNKATWECIGKLPYQPLFKSISPGVSYSNSEREPNWPIEVGSIVQDGDLQWFCTDVFEPSKFAYSTGDTITIKFVKLTDMEFDKNNLSMLVGDIQNVSKLSNFYEYESIDSIQVNAPLYHETKQVIKGRYDYKKIFREITPNIVDTNGFDVSPAVVQLTYVKNHPTNSWLPSTTYAKGDRILSGTPNEFIYVAQTSGRSAINTQGVSSPNAPAWNDHQTVGEIWQDGQVWWQTQNLTTSPRAWTPNTLYRKGDVVKATYAEGYQYKAVKFSVEPIWPTEIGETVTDNEVIWLCADTIYLGGYDSELRRPNKKYNVGDCIEPVIPTGYFYRCTIEGTTANVDPGNWPTQLCDTILDGTAVFECYDTIDSDSYTKNNTLKKLEEYRPYGVEPPTMTDPELVYVVLDIKLELNTIKDETTVSNDIHRLLEQYERKLGLDIINQDIENLLEQNLDYVVIARVDVSNETKTKVWTPGTQYIMGDTVRPTVDNGYHYRLTSILDTREGYSQWTDKGLSYSKEPSWGTKANEVTVDRNINWICMPRSEESIPSWVSQKVYKLGEVVIPTKSNGYKYVVVGLVEEQSNWPSVGSPSHKNEPIWGTITDGLTVDNNLLWKCVKLNGLTPAWQPNTIYKLGEIVTPTNDNGCYYVAGSLVATEPEWPTEPGEAVLDNNIYWVCYEPNTTMVPLTWKQYYILGHTLTLSGE